MSSRYVRFLEEGGDARDIGGKGANLATLRGANFPVPEGFCVTAEAYRSFLESGGLAQAVAEAANSVEPRHPRSVQGVSLHVRRLLLDAPLPIDLLSAISRAYRELAARVRAEPVVAVRSSAVSEDSGGASFAGLHETYLNLRSEKEVMNAVRRCFASLWTAQALQYRAVKGLDSASEAMAVVVLEMVPAQASGVAFTLNPVTGDRGQVVINASWGLGETVVSGRVTPDSFVVDRLSLRLVSREVYEKHLAVYPDPAGRSGTVEKTLEPNLANAPSLSDDQVRQVTQLALSVEKHYGRPQDVEWAHTGEDLYLLQSRPVTTGV